MGQSTPLVCQDWAKLLRGDVPPCRGQLSTTLGCYELIESVNVGIEELQIALMVKAISAS
jgi:hypothetical protein